MLFLAIWFTFSYLPVAHMVWAGTGYLFNLGAYDFAGGTVVHINSGVAALVAAIVLGPRMGFLKEPIPPHNLTFTFVGASLLWVGWFGFHAGSHLEANGLTAQAFLNPITAPAAAALAWGLAEKFTRGHASLLGFASGAVAGLVAITPAAGFAGTVGAIVLGAVAGVVCLWAVVTLKPMLKYDDSLDVFGIHGVGGIVGAIGTAFVANSAWGGYPLDGYEMWGQLVNQVTGVAITIVWSGVVAFVALMIVKAVFGGLRVADLPRAMASISRATASTPTTHSPDFNGAGGPSPSAPIPDSPVGAVLFHLADRGVQLKSLLARHRGFPLANRLGCTPRSTIRDRHLLPTHWAGALVVVPTS